MSERTSRLRKRMVGRNYQALYMGDSYCSFYHDHYRWDYHKVADTEQECFAIFLSDRELLLRYQRYCRYVREIMPEWKEVRKDYFADNSVEAIEENKYGETRRRMIVPPSGDACF